jgi:hypothetical protein
MTEPIFTESDIALFRMDHNKYTLTIQQLKPVVLDHVAKKNENLNIKTYNINRTVETIQAIDTVEDLFRYMENKLSRYEATLNEQAIKRKIQK